MKTVDADDYDDLVQVESPHISPDSERVAYVEKRPTDEERYEATIHVASFGGADSRRFTIAEGVDSEPRWSPDGEFLAFVSTRGADDDRPQLWVLPVDGGEARQVTSVGGGVSGLEWSPDGTKILFTQAVTALDCEEGRDLAAEPGFEPDAPDPRVIDRMIYRAGTEYLDGKRAHVYVLDVERALETEDDRASAIERLTGGNADHVGPTWGDSETVYYARKAVEDDRSPDDSVTFDLLEHDLESGAIEAFAETTGWVDSLWATADGRVAYPYASEDRLTLAQSQIRVYDRETGAETTPTEPLDRDLAHDGHVEWGPDGELLYFTAPDEGSVVCYSVPGDASEPPTPVYGEGVTVEDFSVGLDAIAFVQSEWDHPGDVFATTRGGNEATRLTRVNDAYLTDRAVSQPEEVWIDGDEGPIQGWVLTPPTFDEDETYPLVVEIHGGPHLQWTAAGTMWYEFQALAAAGYVVFWCNPRGSTGYGEEHMTAIERDWGDVTLSDVLAGVETVCEREYVDESEAYVTGGSFGGFMTAWAVTRTDRFRAAVSQRGVYDLTGFYGSTDAFKLIEGDFGTTPWDDPDLLWKHSPVARVADVETPTLVVHADRDYRTPANTAELFYLGLKKHGVDTRLVRYPREGHELSRSGEPAHVVDRIERIVRWFDGYSSHRETPPALERGRDEGLSAGKQGGAEDGTSESEAPTT
ncbi:acylaminoacyl-peptidase [Halostagnicola sp. A56]|uniref:S9 family peptidase n=1 Tax=Halostagnicola sp. A56 TaxID=1495067 RepID=UPI00049F32DF|nr:S9 family peptidase [Halostagnicola sp. A56]KDE58275.1 acylaminoacyl-peptidase [Halostagnicola sp. A56]